MKRITWRLLCALVMLVTLAVGSSCTDGDSMRRQLQALQALNLADSLMTDLPQATALCRYFDRHGTPNERMLAHYLLGRTYADLGEAPQALEEYHAAAECADTTAKDCDYRLLARVHGQQSILFMNQCLPNEMLHELEMEYKFAKKAKDTLTWMCAKEWKHIAYDLLDRDVEAYHALLGAYNEYQDLGLFEQAANCASGLVFYLIKDENYEEAGKFISIYENYSSNFKDGEVCSGAELYYNFKGLYYLGLNKPDSAEYYFRKELRETTSTNNTEAAYKGLTSLYKYMENSDSVAKYADLCYQMSYESFRNSTTDNLRIMQALYNYNQYKTESHKKSEEAVKNKLLFVVSASIGVILMVCFISFIIIYRRKKKEQLKEIEQEYMYRLETLDNAQKDVIRLKQNEYETLLNEKEIEIAENKMLISQLKDKLYIPAELEAQLISSDIYKRLIYLLNHPKERAVQKDWHDLRELFDSEIPNFRNYLSANGHISEDDMLLCMLIRLHFSPSDICVVLGLKPQTVSMKRQRLLKKLFGKDGKGAEFDKIIQSL